jgi:ArsR family transcriptional regulator, arsenate/arsenite/antimonite-responsive transcriptional repressor / arsenate reductase (thioredoxin)
MVEALRLTDLTPGELGCVAGIPLNLLAHHLRILEEAQLVKRRVSEGDGRRRYVTLRAERLNALADAPAIPAGTVAFICTRNSARSQFAAAWWKRRTGGRAESAGSDPAKRIDPGAVKAAAALGIELTGAPKPYDAIADDPVLVVSVCDRAHEGSVPFAAPLLHWSVPDPVAGGGQAAFRRAFDDIMRRAERLSAALPTT